MVRLGQSSLFRTPGSVFSLVGKECCEQAPRTQSSSCNLQQMLFFNSPESIFFWKKSFCSKATVTDFTQVFWEFYFFAFAPFFWCAVSTSTAAWKSTSAWLPCPNLFFSSPPRNLTTWKTHLRLNIRTETDWEKSFSPVKVVSKPHARPKIKNICRTISILNHVYHAYILFVTIFSWWTCQLWKTKGKYWVLFYFAS